LEFVFPLIWNYTINDAGKIIQQIQCCKKQTLIFWYIPAFRQVMLMGAAITKTIARLDCELQITFNISLIVEQIYISNSYLEVTNLYFTAISTFSRLRSISLE